MDKQKHSQELELWGGLECTINRVGDSYFDQFADAGIYNHSHSEAIAAIGFKKLRFPILWEKHQPQRDTQIDWSWAKQQLEFYKQNNVDIIAGLVHHGSGPAFTSLLDKDFPTLLAAYAKEVATQFPWINYYTPVNEPLTTARFSGLYGLWYPHTRDEKGFFTCLLNELKGTVLAMREIRKINPHAQLVQTEDLGKVYSTPLLKYQADFENERRWLTFDILCGRFNEQHPLWEFAKYYSSEEQLGFFIDNPCPPDIFGFNYYVTSERYLDENIEDYPNHGAGGNGKHTYVDIEAARVAVEEPTGPKVLLREAWERFKSPMAVTEIHLHCHREEQIRWFKYVWETCKELKAEGIDLVGATAWAVLGSHGWNKLLTQPNGDYEPGVFDIRGGRLRPTALANYLKGIPASAGEPLHIIGANGWWLRESRFLQPKKRIMERVSAIKQSHQPILIIGKRGTLGQAFGRACESRALYYKLMSRQDCDIADIASVEAAIDHYKPWAIINAAGYVRVDDAEKEKEQCYRENVTGPLSLAIACQKKGVKLVSFSSDLVFDGEKRTPYVESDKTNPLNVYGKSKEEAEEEILKANEQALVVRTSAFFGPWDQYNFMHWVEMCLSAKNPLPVANDIHVSPTYIPDLTNATLDLLIDDEKGFWHLANKGVITWADWAYLVTDYFNGDRNLIKAVPCEDMDFDAPRPRYSVLGSERAHILPAMENAFERYFAEKKSFAELTD